ncbi:MAG: hypothetical protein QOK47_1182 [Actinomycetota bacterium]|jgi:hypothetical protein|nr:hypothetical protein [Actinomycetota bacterium]MEA2447545.1 hypothetical protein [Actinomycetota bacterium]
MRKAIRKSAFLAATALVAASLVVPSATAAPAPCSAREVRSLLHSGKAMEVVSLRTFFVTMKADKPTYAVGDIAKVNVVVSRPAHEDPAHLGVPFDPPQSFPAENVNVGLGLRIGDVFLFGHGITNADGEAQVKVEIKDYTPGGTAIGDGFAWNILHESVCARVEETGYINVPKLFKVTR